MKPKKQTFITAIVMFAAGGCLAFLTADYAPVQYHLPPPAAEETIAETEPETSKPEETEPVTEAPSVPETEPAWQPSVDELNLAWIFPEDADQTDPTQSLGGEIFRILMTENGQWMSNIYNYHDISPVQMASRLSLPRSRVLGGYNPKEASHDPSNPDTWTINSFKNVHMNVTNGDGRPISVYSNVIEIMSLANQYTYYKDPEDYDLFLSYAQKLWKASHSYSVSMSDIYYCQGCMDEADEQRELEEMAEQESQEAQIFSEEEAASGNRSAELPGGNGSETSDSSISGQASADNSVSDQVSGYSEPEINVSEPGNISESGESDSSETYERHEGSAAEESTSGVIVSNMGRASSETEGGTVSNESPDTSALSEQELSDTPTASASNLTPRESSPAGKTGPDQNRCPGHIDLIIHMQIKGLSEKNGLFAADTIGNDAANIEDTDHSAEGPDTEGSDAEGSDAEGSGTGGFDIEGSDIEGSVQKSGWPGWNEEMKTQVRALSSQDWFQKYGLSVSLIAMTNPLTPAEIDSYMADLPEDLSDTRRELIRYALSSVGKIPYHWGGKASHPDYNGNQFGTLVPADTEGRILKGLDCSGWINWVYWSVTGSRLPYESTSGLALCGTKISRSELQPGDIVIRTGEDAHVIMFLGWTNDGRIRCIHESSAGVNNVTVAVRDANWPYYVRILNE